MIIRKRKTKSWTVATSGASNVQKPEGRTISIAVNPDSELIELRFHNDSLTWSTGVVLDDNQLAELSVIIAQAVAQQVRIVGEELDKWDIELAGSNGQSN